MRILEFLFENKEYGAYQLRLNHKRNVLIGIFISILISSLFVFATTVYKPNEIIRYEVLANIQFEDFKEKKKDELQIQKSIEKPIKSAVIKYTAPLIISDNKIKEDEIIPIQDSLESNKKIGSFNQEGKEELTISEPEKTKENGTGIVEIKEDYDYNTVFTSVQIQAEFQGGIEAWKRYLERNLNAEIPVNNGAPAGLYTVVITFIVDKDGNISEIECLNDPGYGIKEEAVRIMKKSPRWNPAQQNGRKVIYKQTQKISFKIEEVQ